MFKDNPHSGIRPVLSGFFKNVGWKLRLTWNKEEAFNKLECETELNLNTESTPGCLSEKNKEKMQ